jgi:hypothetical protein
MENSLHLMASDIFMQNSEEIVLDKADYKPAKVEDTFAVSKVTEMSSPSQER